MISAFKCFYLLVGYLCLLLALVFLNFFFVRFRSRSVRCRFALDLMEAAVAWLGTI